jgi:hypothetical protein
MRYFIAIVHTILLVAVPLIMIPFLQWYKREWLDPDTDLFAIYMLIFILSCGFFVLTIVRWVSAIQDKDFKDLS